jgi:hypothetical protein
LELSKASNVCDPCPVNPLQVQTAHGNVVAAVLPEQVWLPPSTRMMGGPPFWHLAGGEPTGTAPTQLPFAHPVVGPHTCPQVPQLLLSVVVFTHVPLHAVRLAPQVVAQVPLRHTLPPVQTTLQPPQFEGSVLVGMHLPPQKDS